jgi:hypothetical protein
LKEKLDSIDVKFFESVSKDEDVSTIKARGEANKKAAAEQEAASAIRQEEDTKGTDVYLEEGNSYKFKIENAGEFAFKVEAGGVLAGEDINGSIQGARLIFTAKDCEYEGQFVSSTQVQAAFNS